MLTNIINHYYVILHNKRNTFSHYNKKNHLNHGSVQVSTELNWENSSHEPNIMLSIADQGK
jgi:hypothetical protein